MTPHVLVVDNHDSFTYNLVYDLEALGCTTEVYRNDVPRDFLLERARVTGAVFLLSPGPGGPGDAGVCTALVQAAAGPASGAFGVLGICLGHQVIVDAFGGRVGPAREVMHGRASPIRCAPHPVFEGSGLQFVAGRYHSLAAQSVPDALACIATTHCGQVMAVAHRTSRIAGFQFHPESILTTRGRPLLAAALAWVAQR